MKNKHVLIISGRDTSVEKLGKLPIDITLIQSEDRVTKLQEQYCKRVIITDLSDGAQVKTIARLIHETDPFDAAVSFIEYYLELTAEICEELQIQGNSLRAVQLTRDKLSMRKFLENSSIPTVAFKKINSQEEAIDFIKQTNKSIIIKPLDGAGSRLVSKCNSVQDILKCWEMYDPEKQKLIAEEFIEGDEYSVEAYSEQYEHEVLAITKKFTTGEPNFIETGHRLPILLEQETENRIKKTVINFLKMIKQKDGPTHTEIKVFNEKPYIIESHTRYGGDRIWELLFLTSGIHLPQYTVCKLLNLGVPHNPIRNNFAAVEYLISPPGICKTIEGIEKVKSMDGIERVEVSIKKGEEIHSLQSSSDRCGYILAVGETPELVEMKLEAAVNEITILTEEKT